MPSPVPAALGGCWVAAALALLCHRSSAGPQLTSCLPASLLLHPARWHKGQRASCGGWRFALGPWCPILPLHSLPISQVVEVAESELGGCKLASAAISGRGGVYGQLKFESGIHRVQRVPVTESGALRCAVLRCAVLYWLAIM